MMISSNIERIVVPQIVEEMSTRSNGAIVREKALSSIEAGSLVIFDLCGRRITPSFADEVFGKTCLELGFSRFKDVVGVENFNESDRSLIRHVVLKRAEEARDAA